MNYHEFLESPSHQTLYMCPSKKKEKKRDNSPCDTRQSWNGFSLESITSFWVVLAISRTARALCVSIPIAYSLENIKASSLIKKETWHRRTPSLTAFEKSPTFFFLVLISLCIEKTGLIKCLYNMNVVFLYYKLWQYNKFMVPRQELWVGNFCFCFLAKYHKSRW